MAQFGSHAHEFIGCELKLQIHSFNLGTKALVRNKTDHLVWVSCILVMLFGTPFICHQGGSLSDVGMPPTWDKGKNLLPGTTKLGNLRDSHNSVTAPTDKPDLGFSSSMLRESWSVEPTQGHQKCDRWCTGTLDKLVGYHTKLAIYPTLTICCWRVVICASFNTRSKGMQVVTYPANIKQLKSYWLKSSPKGLGTCISINKTHSLFWLCSAPQEAPR